MLKYNELKSYLPTFFAQITDVEYFLQSAGKQMDSVDADAFRMRDNNFILLADEETIARWERFMGITYDERRTLTDRRNLIISFMTSTGKIGATEIKDIVRVFTPSPVQVTLANSVVSVKITRDISETFILSDCYAILRKKVPCHLELKIEITSSFESSYYIGAAITSYKEEVMN